MYRMHTGVAAAATAATVQAASLVTARVDTQQAGRSSHAASPRLTPAPPTCLLHPEGHAGLSLSQQPLPYGPACHCLARPPCQRRVIGPKHHTEGGRVYVAWVKGRLHCWGGNGVCDACRGWQVGAV